LRFGSAGLHTQVISAPSRATLRCKRRARAERQLTASLQCQTIIGAATGICRAVLPNAWSGSILPPVQGVPPPRLATSTFSDDAKTIAHRQPPTTYRAIANRGRSHCHSDGVHEAETASLLLLRDAPTDRELRSLLLRDALSVVDRGPAACGARRCGLPALERRDNRRGTLPIPAVARQHATAARLSARSRAAAIENSTRRPDFIA